MKCKTLLFSRLYIQGKNVGSATADWLKKWGLLIRQENPPHVQRIPGNLAYLQHYAMDMAYVNYPERGQTTRSMRKSLYATLSALEKAGKPEPLMRVRLNPGTRWDMIWENLNEACIPSQIKTQWYR